MHKKTYSSIFLMLIIILISLACISPVVNIKSDQTTILSTPRLIDKQKDTQIPDSENNQVSISITEAEVNSWVIAQFSKQSDPILYNPEVHLQNEVIQVDGTLKQGPISSDISLKFQIIKDKSGKYILDLISANFGTIPVPAAIVNTIINSIDLNNLIDNTGESYKIQNVKIANGLLIVTGNRQ